MMDDPGGEWSRFCEEQYQAWLSGEFTNGEMARRWQEARERLVDEPSAEAMRWKPGDPEV